MDNTLQLGSYELDVLKEIGSIGSGNAATALSQMINKRVIIRPVKTELIRVEDVPKEIGGAETLVMAVYLKIMGDMTGNAVYLHSKQDAMKLINMISGAPESQMPNVPSEENISVYKEMSNIFTGSYLNAISSMLDVMMIPSVPHYAFDMLGSLIDFLLSEISQKVDKILMIKTEMIIDYKDIGGSYLMVFDPESLNKMLNLVHTKFGIDGKQ